MHSLTKRSFRFQIESNANKTKQLKTIIRNLSAYIVYINFQDRRRKNSNLAKWLLNQLTKCEYRFASNLSANKTRRQCVYDFFSISYPH